MTNATNIGDVDTIQNLIAPAVEGSSSVSPAPTAVAGINQNTILIEQLSSTSTTQGAAIDLNTSNIAANLNAINLNAGDILANSGLIANNTTAIGVNTAAIGTNSNAINSLRNGTAAVSSLPDLYLLSDETWTIAGGVSAYDDGFGNAQIGFGGGVQLRGSTSDKWSVGVVGAVSGDVGVVRLQGRIGG